MGSYPGRKVEWKLYAAAGGDPLTIKHEQWNIRRTRGESLSWSLTFVESDNDYTPTGPLGPLFNVDPFDENFSLRRWLICEITVGADTWTSPPLVHTDFQVEVEPDKVTCVISGTDQTEALLAQDEFMAEVRSTPGSGYSAKTVLEEIFTKYKIDNRSLLFDDYLLQVFYRVGTPMDWVRQILEVRQAWFGWEGDTLVCRPGGLDASTATADFSLTDKQKCKLVSYHRSATGIVNEVTLQRVGESLAAMDKPQDGKALGWVDVTLDREVNFATLSVVLPAGSQGIVGNTGVGLEADGNPVWYDADNNVLNTVPVFIYIGETPAKKVRFTLVPPVGAGPDPDPIPYRAMVYGTAHNPDFGSFESSYTVTYADSADQALRGKRKRRSPMVVGLVPNGGVAATFAQAWVKEALRKYTIMQVQALLNPTHRPGLFCALTVGRLGLADYVMLVETVDWSGSATEMVETLELSRGAA